MTRGHKSILAGGSTALVAALSFFGNKVTDYGDRLTRVETRMEFLLPRVAALDGGPEDVTNSSPREITVHAREKK